MFALIGTAPSDVFSLNGFVATLSEPVHLVVFGLALIALSRSVRATMRSDARAAGAPVADESRVRRGLPGLKDSIPRPA